MGAHGARRHRALTAFALLVAGYLVLRALGIGPAGSLLAAGKLIAQDRVLVAAFDAPAKDSALGDVVRRRCARTSRSRAPCSSCRRAAHRRRAASACSGPTRRAWTSTLAREIAQREGIKAVVSGSVASAGGGYIITARLVSAASGDELAVYQESAATRATSSPRWTG